MVSEADVLRAEVVEEGVIYRRCLGLGDYRHHMICICATERIEE